MQFTVSRWYSQIPSCMYKLYLVIPEKKNEKNIFACLFSVHNAISLHVMSKYV